jgi:hypothetical protein
MNSQKVVIVGVIGVCFLVALFLFTRRSPSDQSSFVDTEEQAQTIGTTLVSPTGASQQSIVTVTPVVRRITLTMSSPVSGATVSTSTIAVSGKTAPNAEVFVNESETRADASGNFSVQMSLDEGDNYIIVVANDADGNAAEAELTVIYSP